MFNVITQLKFNKRTGRFTLKQLREINTDDCCSVCMETTTTKTKCNHLLCYECWEKINKKICPLCRKNIKNCCEIDEFETTSLKPIKLNLIF